MQQQAFLHIVMETELYPRLSKHESLNPHHLALSLGVICGLAS